MDIDISILLCSRVMESKWGKTSETIKMTLNVEQVQLYSVYLKRIPLADCITAKSCGLCFHRIAIYFRYYCVFMFFVAPFHVFHYYCIYLLIFHISIIKTYVLCYIFPMHSLFYYHAVLCYELLFFIMFLASEIAASICTLV